MAELEQNEPEVRDEEGRDGEAAQQLASQSAPELAALRSERDALLDRLARLQAEFDNFRKRAAREAGEYRDYALADALKALLPVVDNFDLALRAPGAAHANAAEKLRKGVDLIRRQLADTLERLGLKAVPAAGQPFDPHQHEAIEMVETDDAQDNHVLEELQRGYRLKDRLLRPAMVRVARNPNRK